MNTYKDRDARKVSLRMPALLFGASMIVASCSKDNNRPEFLFGVGIGSEPDGLASIAVCRESSEGPQPITSPEELTDALQDETLTAEGSWMTEDRTMGGQCTWRTVGSVAAGEVVQLPLR